MFRGLLSMFHVDSTAQLRRLIESYGHYLPSEQRELINAIINEVDKGENMNKHALAAAAEYLSGSAEETESFLQQNMSEGERQQAESLAGSLSAEQHNTFSHAAPQNERQDMQDMNGGGAACAAGEQPEMQREIQPEQDIQEDIVLYGEIVD